MKVNLRMNLSHFLNKPYEERVIKKLGEVHNDSIKYYLNLWYKDGDLKPDDIRTFIKKHEKNLHFKTNIVVGNSIAPNDFIWFDITDVDSVINGNQIRFQYRYQNEEDILIGLEEFHKCAKFCTSEKPPKRQKRNDYESSNNRK